MTCQLGTTRPLPMVMGRACLLGQSVYLSNAVLWEKDSSRAGNDPFDVSETHLDAHLPCIVCQRRSPVAQALACEFSGV